MKTLADPALEYLIKELEGCEGKVRAALRGPAIQAAYALRDVADTLPYVIKRLKQVAE